MLDIHAGMFMSPAEMIAPRSQAEKCCLRLLNFQCLSLSEQSSLKEKGKMLLGNDATYPCAEFIVMTTRRRVCRLIRRPLMTRNFSSWYFPFYLRCYDRHYGEKWIFYGFFAGINDEKEKHTKIGNSSFVGIVASAVPQLFNNLWTRSDEKLSPSPK